MREHGTFEIWQDGIRVARGAGPIERVHREANHYAMMYSQDGPVEVKIKVTPTAIRNAAGEKA